MRVAFIQGHFSTSTRGPYRVDNLASHDFSGSESFYFNMVRELASMGHEIDAYGFWTREHREGGVHYIPFNVHGTQSDVHLVRPAEEYDAAVAWNEPDYLSIFPPSVKRVCLQQLNDFDYCTTDYKQFTDLYLLPSQRHLEHIIPRSGLDPAKCAVLSNCVAAEDNFTGPEDHQNHKIVYCSSPDRGLHWLAEFFPKVRARVPDAELHIFYRIDSWLNRFNGEWGADPAMRELGSRSRYITDFVRRWGNGQGVFVAGPVPNKRIVEVMQTSRLLAYPCDTVSFTEGLGVTVLDACRGGAFPLISDVDAFGQVYGGHAHVIPGRPGDNRQEWVDTMVRALTDDLFFQEVTERCKLFVRDFTRASRAEALVVYLSRKESSCQAA